MGGVVGDVFYGLVHGLGCDGGFVAGGPRIAAAGGLGVRFFGFFGEDGAGDLEAVEEEAGAAGVDGVGGDALEDLADGLEDGGAIIGIGQREVEGGAAAAALLRVGDGFSGGVVVVAEVFVAEAGAGAAVAVGEDVAALVVIGCGVGLGLGCGVDGVVHVFPPPLGEMCAKSSKEKTCFRTSSVAGR